MRALIADDERLARKRLRRMLERLDDVEIAAEAADGEETLTKVSEVRPDVVFLDIRMPEMDGLEVARRLPEGIRVVFTTAYDSYAVEAFDAAAVDYLLKPIEEERLAKAVEKLRKLAATPASAELQLLFERLSERRATGELPRVTARRGDTLRVFDPREISRFHAADRYTVFRHGGREYLLDESIVSLERRLARLGFVKVHRSELINLAAVRALRREDDQNLAELADGQRAVISRRHLKQLKERLGIPR
jgi:two-component system LytT family response regulator